MTSIHKTSTHPQKQTAHLFSTEKTFTSAQVLYIFNKIMFSNLVPLQLETMRSLFNHRLGFGHKQAFRCLSFINHSSSLQLRHSSELQKDHLSRLLREIKKGQAYRNKKSQNPDISSTISQEREMFSKTNLSSVSTSVISDFKLIHIFWHFKSPVCSEVYVPMNTLFLHW